MDGLLFSKIRGGAILGSSCDMSLGQSSWDIEVLAVSMQTYNLPCDIYVYIPPSVATPHNTVTRLPCQHPEAFVTITGDFIFMFIWILPRFLFFISLLS